MDPKDQALAIPPYTLDLTTSKEVNGVTLHQLVAAQNFQLFRSVGVHMQVSLDIQKGTRGGWVPSLEVLEYHSDGFPWLDERSHIATPNTRFKGPVYFINSQWNGDGYFEAPVDHLQNTWPVENSTFEGTNTIALTDPPFTDESARYRYENKQIDVDPLSDEFYEYLGDNVGFTGWKNVTAQDVRMHGKTYVNDTQLHNIDSHVHKDLLISNSNIQNSTLRNDTPGFMQLNHCQWQAVHITKGYASDHIRCHDTGWIDVQLTTSDEHTPYYGFSYDIMESKLIHVSCTHGHLSNMYCHYACATGERLSLRSPLPSEHSPSEAVNVRGISVEKAGAVTHVLWYRDNDTNEPFSVQDLLTQRTIACEHLPAYIEELRGHTDSPAHQQSANTLQWWQWQYALGIEPPYESAWRCPESPPLPSTGADLPSFACGESP